MLAVKKQNDEKLLKFSSLKIGKKKIEIRVFFRPSQNFSRLLVKEKKYVISRRLTFKILEEYIIYNKTNTIYSMFFKQNKNDPLKKYIIDTLKM